MKLPTQIHKATVEERLLLPLFSGQQVVLHVDDPKLPKRRRQKEKLIFLTPVNRGYLLVSMPAYGSELIDLSMPVKAIHFMRVGLNHALSAALANALNKLKGAAR